MEKRKGLVLKMQSRSCIVITPEGDFCKIPLPKHPVQVGEEIFFINPARFYAFKKTFLVAASILLLLLAVPAYRGLTPAVAAYVSLDINPSVEFAVDTGQKISAVHGLNTAGEELLKRVKPVHLDIYKGIELVVTEALKNHYLDQSKENIVLSAITALPEAKPVVSEHNIYEAINKPLQSTGIKTEVLVETVDEDTGKKAQKAGVSSGKYFLYVQAQKKGVAISIPELKKENIVQLQKDKHIKIRELVSQHVMEQRRPDDSIGQQNPEGKPGKTEAVQLQNKPNKSVPDKSVPSKSVPNKASDKSVPNKSTYSIPKSDIQKTHGQQKNIKDQDTPDESDGKTNNNHQHESKSNGKKSGERQ